MRESGNYREVASVFIELVQTGFQYFEIDTKIFSFLVCSRIIFVRVDKLTRIHYDVHKNLFVTLKKYS